MSDSARGQTYGATGTTPPIYVGDPSNAKVVRPGETYFTVRIRSAQAAFAGRFWERVRHLVVASQVSLGTRHDGAEPMRALQRFREVRPGRAEQLGLSPNLVDLVPATMDRISISIEFLLDRENRLQALAGLINDDAFLAAVSLAPAAAIAARTVGSISQKLIQAFLPADERKPILQFSGDFNIATGELLEGSYVILGTRDEQSLLPMPLPQLRVENGLLVVDGQPVTRWSYVIFDVRCIDARTRDLSQGAAWSGKLREAEAVAQRLAVDPLAREGERSRAWDECKALLKEAQILLLGDPNYLAREVRDIIAAAYLECTGRLFREHPSRRGSGTPSSEPRERRDAAADRTLLGLPPTDEELRAIRHRYAQQVANSRTVIRDTAIR